jgi:hypothetical protein
LAAFFDRFGDDAYFDPDEPMAREGRRILKDRHGCELRQPVAVELDALAPADLRQAFRDEIRRLTDLPDVDDLTEAEQEQQDKIDVATDLCDRYSLDELRELLGRPRRPGWIFVFT